MPSGWRTRTVRKSSPEKVVSRRCREHVANQEQSRVASEKERSIVVGDAVGQPTRSCAAVNAEV